jgi:5-methylcytosine-specific restriction endonuclease McrA
MIHINELALSAATQSHLQTKQQAIDGEADYPARRRRAQRDWKGRDNDNVPFREIKKNLTDMCHGPGRCGYCEDSEANQIEHIQPKSLYPEATFSWTNYLYVCSGCNQPKLDHYAVFRAANRQRVDHVHPRKSNANPHPIPVPPPDGDPLFINPRVDNPMELLFLDLKTMMFDPCDTDPASEAHQRAIYTRDLLKLNKRDSVVEARRGAYRNYLAHLRHYAQDIASANYDQAHLNAIERDIKGRAHPTVWKEMQRQHNLPVGSDQKAYPLLFQLFSAVPDALTW